MRIIAICAAIVAVAYMSMNAFLMWNETNWLLYAITMLVGVIAMLIIIESWRS
jgi:hypothetical protein